MKVLIIGAKGQLGYEFCRIFKNDAISTDADTLDITNKSEIMSAPDCDIIVNCSAYTNVDGAEDDFENAYKVNVEGVENLTELAKMRNIPIVHISTDYVFDGEGSEPYRETDKANPKSVYGKTKFKGEEIVRKYPKHFIVRTAWLYGINGKNFVKTIARAGREKGNLKVVSDQVGSPTNAKDLALQISRLIQTDKFGTYHCTGSGRCSWYEFACEIIKILEIPCKITPCKTEEYPAKAKRPKFSVLDNTKMESVTKSKMPEWNKSLESFLIDYKDKM